MADAGALYCSSCGKGVSGKFCAHCGAAVAAVAQDSEGWATLVTDPLLKASRHSLVGIMRGMALHPARTAVELTREKAFAGEWKFLIASIGIFYSLFNIVFPRILMGAVGAEVGDKWQLLAMQIVTIGCLIILAVPTYYAGRWLSGRRQTPRAFLKLMVMGYGYYFLLVAVLTSLILGTLLAGIALRRYTQALELPPLFLWSLFQAVPLTIYGAVIFIVTILNRRFWPMSSGKAFCIAVAFFGLSRLVVFPLAGQVLEYVDVIGWLKMAMGS